MTDAIASEELGDCHKSEEQKGLTTGTLSVIGEEFKEKKFSQPLFILSISLMERSKTGFINLN